MEPVIIRNFRDHLVHGYRLTVWCPGCQRSAHCNFAELVMRGLGDLCRFSIDRVLWSATQQLAAGGLLIYQKRGGIQAGCRLHN